MPKILIVDDDRALISLLEDVLQPDYLTVFASDGVGALHQLAAEQPDLVLLDLRLPGMDGALLLQKIRALSQTPIIVLSARDTQADRVLALRAGADDFIAKPFDLYDLLARIEAVLRRSRRVPAMVPVEEIRLGELMISPTHGTVRVGHTRIHLTPIETYILCALAVQPGETVSIASLGVAGWGMEDVTLAQTIRMHIKHLRQKLQQASGPYIDTRHGAGYVLTLESP